MSTFPDIARQSARCLKQVSGARMLLFFNLVGVLLNVLLLRIWTAYVTRPEQATYAAADAIVPSTQRHCDIVVGISTVCIHIALLHCCLCSAHFNFNSH